MGDIEQSKDMMRDRWHLMIVLHAVNAGQFVVCIETVVDKFLA